MAYAHDEEEKASEGGVSAGSCSYRPHHQPQYAPSESSHIGSLHIASGESSCADDDVVAARKAHKRRKLGIVALGGVVLVLVIALAVSVAMMFEGRRDAGGQQQYAALQADALEGAPSPTGQQTEPRGDETPPLSQATAGEEESVPDDVGGVAAEEEAPAEEGIIVWIPKEPTIAPTAAPTTSAPSGAPVTTAPTGAPTGAPTESPSNAPAGPAGDEDGGGDGEDADGDEDDGDEDEMSLAAWDPESYDEPGRDELAEMGCWDSFGNMACCVSGLFC